MFLSNHLQNNIHYEDRGFPASNAPKQDEERWIRIDQIEDNSCRGKGPWKIFKNPSPDDAIQGAAENCWYDYQTHVISIGSHCACQSCFCGDNDLKY